MWVLAHVSFLCARDACEDDGVKLHCPNVLQVDFWLESEVSAPQNDLTTAQMIERLRSSLQLAPLAVELICPGAPRPRETNATKGHARETDTEIASQLESDPKCDSKVDRPEDGDPDTDIT